MGVTGLGGIIHVVGGVGSTPDEFSYQYFPESDEWQVIMGPIDQPWHSMGLVGIETRIFMLGGLIDDKPSAANIAYHAIYSIALPIVQ